MPLPKVLTDLYDKNEVLGPDGTPMGPRSQVVREYAEALYRVVRGRRPSVVLEIGMAYGATALAAAGALEENGSGKVISIDPFQSSEWQNVGVLNLKRAGLDHRHELIEDFDYLALPRLLGDGLSVGVAYVDGFHSYEYALLDFFYVDRMLSVGGVVGFNDCDWSAVLPTLRFLERHRAYARIDVGLPRLYSPHGKLVAQYMRMERRLPRGAQLTRFRPVAETLGRRREDRYYEKRSDWEPPEGWMPQHRLRPG